MSAATYSRRRWDARRRPSTSRASRAPAASWPMNVTRPSGRTARVWALAASCSSAAKRIASPRVSSSAHGSAQQRADRAGVPAQPGRLRVALQQRDGVEHLERVLVDVGVVVDALLEPAQRASSGSTASVSPYAVISSSPRRAASRADPLELGEHALGGDALDLRRVRRHRGARRRLEVEAELDGDPHGAQRAQRVVGQRALGDHPHDPALEVLPAAVRVEQLAAAQRLGHRVDREVALRRGRPRCRRRAA